MKHPAVFLDRDGVINAMVYNAEFGTVDSPCRVEDLVLLPDVVGAISELKRLGYLAVVISNQPGVAKGKFTPALLEAMTHKMESLIHASGGRLDGIYYCLHHPEARFSKFRKHCDCRKPKPGLIFKAARELEIDLSGSYLIGDGLTDIRAGQAANLTTVLVGSPKLYVYDEMDRQKVWPDHLVGNLAEGVRMIKELTKSFGKSQDV